MTHDIDSKIIDNKKEMKDTENPSVLFQYSHLRFSISVCADILFAYFLGSIHNNAVKDSHGVNNEKVVAT